MPLENNKSRPSRGMAVGYDRVLVKVTSILLRVSLSLEVTAKRGGLSSRNPFDGK